MHFQDTDAVSDSLSGDGKGRVQECFRCGRNDYAEHSNTGSGVLNQGHYGSPDSDRPAPVISTALSDNFTFLYSEVKGGGEVLVEVFQELLPNVFRGPSFFQ